MAPQMCRLASKPGDGGSACSVIVGHRGSAFRVRAFVLDPGDQLNPADLRVEAYTPFRSAARGRSSGSRARTSTHADYLRAPAGGGSVLDRRARPVADYGSVLEDRLRSKTDYCKTFDGSRQRARYYFWVLHGFGGSTKCSRSVPGRSVRRSKCCWSVLGRSLRLATCS